MTDIPQAVLRARQMYVDGVPVRTIMATTGLNLDQFYRALDGLPQPDGSTLLPPIPRRKIIVRRLSRSITRVVLVRRLMRAAELQLHGLEQQLEKAGYVPGESERNSRTTALLARTMRELTALDESNHKPPPDEADNDPIPRDIDEFRRELARRIGALVDAQRDSVSEGAGGTAASLG